MSNRILSRTAWVISGLKKRNNSAAKESLDADAVENYENEQIL